MDLGTLVQKVYDLVAAARAGNYMVALMLTLEIIKALAGVLPVTSFGKPRAMQSSVDCDDMTIDELCVALDDCCKQHVPMQGGTTGTVIMQAPPTGPVIDAMLPILAALLRKLLGF